MCSLQKLKASEKGAESSESVPVPDAKALLEQVSMTVDLGNLLYTRQCRAFHSTACRALDCTLWGRESEAERAHSITIRQMHYSVIHNSFSGQRSGQILTTICVLRRLPACPRSHRAPVRGQW